MVSPLYGFKVFWVSLVLCVGSSATIYLSIVWFVRIQPFLLSSPFLIRDILGFLALGAFNGLLKSLPVSAIAYVVKPSLRRQLIVGSTVVLSVIEVWIVYEDLTWTFPFG